MTTHAWFDALPPQGVQRLDPSDIDTVREGARLAGDRYRCIDLHRCKDRRDVYATLASALAFPGSFGANLDALYDALTDLEAPPGKGYALVLEGAQAPAGFAPEQREALLDVFRDAAAFHAEGGMRFRVFYTTA